jgi:hypothetical protein
MLQSATTACAKRVIGTDVEKNDNNIILMITFGNKTGSRYLFYLLS